MDDSKLATLLIRHEILDVLYTYCRGIDRLDEELVRSCYHPDAIDNHGLYNGSVDHFVANAFARQSKVKVAHHTLHNSMIEILGPAAVVETYASAVERNVDDAGGMTDMCVGLRYVDRFESRDSGPWLIAKRTVVIDWSRMVSVDEGWLGGVDFTRGARDRSDLVYAELEQLRGGSSA
jgi:hypothetical protein